ncbi:MAG TPA: hypothetical protein VJ063_13595 [Verrucomicrobiae bacterium]|nr:hypothetical protein [Verrucomicrobiae bacterium]
MGKVSDVRTRVIMRGFGGMEQQEFKHPLAECPHVKRHIPIRWHRYESFPVPMRHHCLKLPRARWTRFLRQQVARG